MLTCEPRGEGRGDQPSVSVRSREALEKDLEALLEALGAPALIVRPSDGRVELASSAWRGRVEIGAPLSEVMPAAAGALTQAEPPPAGVEWRSLGPDRILVVERRSAEREAAYAQLDGCGSEDELGRAVVRAALAEGAADARVVRVDEDGASTPVAGHGAWQNAPRRRWLWAGRYPRLALETPASPQAVEAALERLARRACAQAGRLRTMNMLERVAARSIGRAAEFGALVENVPLALLLTDARGGVLVANAAAHELFGAEVRHLSDVRACILKPATAADAWDQARRDGGGLVATVSLRSRHRVRKVALELRPLQAGDGRVDGFVVNARDVTAEEGRIGALQGLVKLGQVAMTPLPHAQLAGRLVETLRESFRCRACAIWAGVPGASASAWLASTGRPELVQELSRHEAVVRTQQAGAAHVELVDNARVFVVSVPLGHESVVVAALRSDESPLPARELQEGVALLGAIVAQGLEMARSWAEVEGAKTLVMSALDALPDAVVVTDGSGCVKEANAESRVLWNQVGVPTGTDAPSMLRALGLRRQDGGAVDGVVERALAGERLIEDAWYEAQEGHARRDVVLHALPLPGGRDGHQGGAVVVARDVTQLRELDRLKNAFVSVAAHELRNPLSTMKAWLHMSLGAEQPAAPERTRRVLEGIARQTEKMERLVDDLLDVSRLSVGRMHLQRRLLDLSEVAAAVLAQVAATSNGHRFTLDASGSVTVFADETRLEQVLTNLLTNAVRYSPDGGAIRLAVGVDADDAVVEVRDEGVGIPPEQLQRVFERYYRAPPDLRLGADGLGVGLWICHELVAMHGGRIEVESHVGRGSTFRVRLPLGHPDKTHARTGQTEPLTGQEAGAT